MFYVTPFSNIELREDTKISFVLEKLVATVVNGDDKISFLFDCKENLILFVDEISFCLESLYSKNIIGVEVTDTDKIIEDFISHFGGEK